MIVTAVLLALLACLCILVAPVQSTTPDRPNRFPVTDEDMARVLQEVETHQDDANAIIQLAVGGSFRGVTWDRLAELTDTIGHRLCGSESLADAVAWSVDRLTAEGFDNVHTEEVSEPRWIRGMESATLLSPRKRPQPLAMLGLGSSIGTPPYGIEADVIVLRNFSEATARAAEIKGKIVVWNQYCDWRASPVDCYGVSVAYRSSGATTAAQYGAVASFTRSVTGFSMATPHTGGSTRASIPAAALTVEDVDMLQRMQDRGQRPRISLFMEAHTDTNVVGHNVIAEIKGSTYPDEVVLVSGHLDSWDVGVGAMDDADGAVLSWSALSLVKKAGLRPKRTLRLLMWSCEEQGGIGGRKYYQDHQAELSKMDAVFESDLGVFRPYGLELTANNATRTIVAAIGQLQTAINTSAVVGGGEGTDISSWIQQGVPAGSLYNDNSRYFNYHHTHADRMNVLDPYDMDLAAASWAIYAYTIADLDAMLPRGNGDEEVKDSTEVYSDK